VLIHPIKKRVDILHGADLIYDQEKYFTDLFQARFICMGLDERKDSLEYFGFKIRRIGPIDKVTF